jgi:hypothetical protein
MDHIASVDTRGAKVTEGAASDVPGALEPFLSATGTANTVLGKNKSFGTEGRGQEESTYRSPVS